MKKKIFTRIFLFSAISVIATATLMSVAVSILQGNNLPDFSLEMFKTELPYILIILAVGIILSLLCSLAITKAIIDPIEQLGEHIDEIDKVETYKELQPFVEKIKKQNEKKHQLDKQKKQFTANVSHELKTPLTSIAGYAELIENGMVQEQDIKPFAHTIRKQALRLVTLAEDIIKLSQLEENDGQIVFEEVNLAELAEECVSALEINAHNRGVTLALNAEETYVKGNKSLLEELLYNLCDNAIRYNKENGSVTVTISKQDGKGVLSVADTGIGIPDKYKVRIFERFFRVDKSRSKETGGTGLGLAIVKHISQVHNATLTLDSHENEGTTITVIFPE